MANTPFNCLIEATTDGDKAYYFATVEDDGFIYFNDSRFFRVECPQNVHDLETAGQTITINRGIQLWYVVRNVWVYSNLFTSLKLEMIHGSDIDKQDLQNGLNTLNRYINNLGSQSIATNGQAIYDIADYLDSLYRDLINQGINVTAVPSITLYRTWNNNPDYTLR